MLGIESRFTVYCNGTENEKSCDGELELYSHEGKGEYVELWFQCSMCMKELHIDVNIIALKAEEDRTIVN